MLLGQEVSDIDIATVWTPQDAIKALEGVGIKVIPTGIEHGTVTAIVNKKSFEITSLRRDVATDGRRAVVAYTQDWREDAQRRDFTMNTLLADGDGHIYDPTGRGLADLEARRVVFVGEPANRIAEDYLRILRFFRFHAQIGRGEPDQAALSACRAAADKIETLSRERITQELFKILSVDDPVDIVSIMFQNSILNVIHYPEYQPDFFRHVCTFQNRYGLAFIAARLYVLAGLKLQNVRAIEKFLLIPKIFQKDIHALHEVLSLPALDNDQAVKVAVYKHGRVPTAQALMIELAQDRVMNGYAPQALKIIQTWNIPDFPVNGEDLIAQGYKPGPELGRALTEREEEWIKAGFET
ncbi:MAG: CCA tRNA nucleotidyltransferase [Alphaproteobacteria bacterium]|nr:CCA tRNA nucleotidyltransferase [Alphaproteobacteria bacterium]